VLSRKDYFSSNAVYTSVDSTLSVFGEDNYDEDEGTINDIDSQVNSAVQNCSSDGIQPYPQVNLAKENVGLLPHSEECLDFDYELLQVLSRLDLELYPCNQLTQHFLFNL